MYVEFATKSRVALPSVNARDLLKQAVEIGLRVILDLNSPPLLAELYDTNSSPESSLQFFNSGADIRVWSLFGLGTRPAQIRSQILHQGFHLADGKSSRRSLLRNFNLLFGCRQA